MKLNYCLSFLVEIYSRHAEKYVRRGRLDWPEGAASRESIRAVQKLPRLQVCISLPLRISVAYLMDCRSHLISCW